MSHLNRILQRLPVVLLVGALQPGFTMQLGPSKGSAIFGRPLDLTIPVRLDAPAEDVASCFNAEVFQADNKFDAGRVRIDVSPATNGLDVVVRVRSTTSVTEPWAKVILRNNCGTKVTRQYDFLTDFIADMPAVNTPTELAATINLPATNTTTSQPTQQTWVASSALPVLSMPPVSNGSVQRAQTLSKTTTADKTPLMANSQSPQKLRRAVKPLSTTAEPSMVASVAPTGQSRLKMETFELTDEHQIMLKLSSAMIAPTGMRTPQEIEALAQATAVWRAINGMPAAAVAAAPLPSSPIQAANDATMLASTQAHQPFDAKREFSNPLVYGLLGLLALTLGCMAWLVIRARKNAQTAYGWLAETAELADEPTQEPIQEISTQFMAEVAIDTDSEIYSGVEPQLEEPSQAIIALDNTPISETAFNASPLAALLSKKDSDEAKEDRIPVNVNESASIKNKSFSAAATPANVPKHFDDSRFDERVLEARNRAPRHAHDKTLTSSSELIDLVLTDSAPKLRSVPNPIPALDSSIGLAAKPASKHHKKAVLAPVDEPTPSSKHRTPASESKSNLIDFEIFAVPPPLQKPSRFVG
jgi:hypothetical protein